MTYDTNDRLRLNFTKEKRLPMIEEGDEYAQSKKWDPYGCIDHVQILKNKHLPDDERRTPNEEQCRN